MKPDLLQKMYLKKCAWQEQVIPKRHILKEMHIETPCAKAIDYGELWRDQQPRKKQDYHSLFYFALAVSSCM